MDFQRLFLFLIFTFSALILWQNGQQNQAPAQTMEKMEAVASNKHNEEIGASKKDQSQVLSAAINQVKQGDDAIQGELISVQTDTFKAEINTLGGDIEHIELLKHKDAVDKNKNFVFLHRLKNRVYVAQSGLIGNQLPTHKTIFSTSAKKYELSDGKNQISVKLIASNSVVKTITFYRGKYLVDVSYDITNFSSEIISPSAYFQLVRDDSPPEGDSRLVPTYTGAAVYTEQSKFEKIPFSDIEKNKLNYPKNADNGWIAILQHYFVAAWLPESNLKREYYAKSLGNKLYSVGTILPVGTINPGQTGNIHAVLYIGPATSNLDIISPGLGLTIDYGWLTIIARPLFWLLTQIQGLVQNWGVAIVLLTVLIKLLFFPLSAASYRSMGRMRAVAPKLEKIKQQYADDREKLNRAMMELYKSEKINPLGGCLPMLIQIPVFISLYWAILSSVELRHAPFFGWISDLSASDPYYVLPVIMGVSMIIQSKLSPAPPDPLQAKLMRIMPIMFSFVFFFFPAGLVLYSVVNNVLSILQQWYITRNLESGQGIAVKS